ncbi:high affinity cAMP-specific and IBMX-insensitive 3',5'-cyclic phosphodiesterase 8 [Sitodiplosis mosellana]|uniref:high affinity cAMP-specific and IBMX-insensitive 3',5'-cyclic phosphodiesterase 8 n=1 Tax=Sitodiplosis mosellana TaxID=263140 RepID=UPI002444DCD4|nr:high affinity cAMP-specific and IBMX-insensitive 3',5'-cyclic phosphodiesterase 8 [Sitodiplosis mosellana]
MDTFLSLTLPEAIESFQNITNGGHNLIIVDGRLPQILDPETVARAIKTSNGGQYTTLAILLKSNTFEKDDAFIMSLLDSGYSKCLMESQLLPVYISKLREIQYAVRQQSIIATQQVLYASLNANHEPIIITDDVFRIQYANKAAERLFDVKVEEILSRPLVDVTHLNETEVQCINVAASTSAEFDLKLSVKRKSSDAQSVNCHFKAVTCIGRKPTHFLITFGMTPNNSTVTDHMANDASINPVQSTSSLSALQQSQTTSSMPKPNSEPRGSLHGSIRRGSYTSLGFDARSIASENIRRTSLAKLSALPLEAPITKVVSILSQVQESCSPDEAKLLDKVMEFLKREGLYSPQVKDMRTDDPVATDLIGALLTQGPSNTLSSRRSSNDSVVRTTNRQGSVLLPLKGKGNSIVNDLLQSCLDWNFDIFRLEQLSERHPLVFLGMELFRRFEVFAAFNIDERTCKAWLSVIEAHYHSTNTYHNSTHAADVMQATAVFLCKLQQRDSQLMDRIDEATALVSAAAHDIDHPGRSSAFLCNSNSSLAILYNDTCVLESHHAALMFHLTLNDDKINIFKNLDRETYKLVRSVIIDMILATEMTRHFEHLAKFVSVFGTENEHEVHTDSDDNHMLIRRMLIKCADVSNPARPFRFCAEWAERIAEEYFTQTDEEKRFGLPIVMPMFDRSTCSIAKSQIGFIEFIIQDMMKAWDGFIRMPQLITCMEYNYIQWKQRDVQPS